MTTYTAIFSNGQIVTRTSRRPYRYAVGLVHKQTGKLRNVKFTAGEPTPDWNGVASIVRPRYGISQKDADRWTREALAEREKWTVEVVKL